MKNAKNSFCSSRFSFLFTYSSADYPTYFCKVAPTVPTPVESSAKYALTRSAKPTLNKFNKSLYTFRVNQFSHQFNCLSLLILIIIIKIMRHDILRIKVHIEVMLLLNPYETISSRNNCNIDGASYSAHISI